MTTTQSLRGDTRKNLVLMAGDYPATVMDKLTQTIHAIGYETLPAQIGAFASGERFCELYPNQQTSFAQNKADIAGAHVHIILQTADNLNDLLVDALNTVATVKAHDPADIHVIMPFAPYARQDRAFDNRFCSQTGQNMPSYLKTAGADYFTTFDIHSQAAENAYRTAFGDDNVNMMTAMWPLYYKARQFVHCDHLIKYGAPDGGDKPDDFAQKRAHLMADLACHMPDRTTDFMFFIDKNHTSASTTQAHNLRGRVQGSATITVDDIADTGGTLINAAHLLKAHGAKQNITAITHGVFSSNSLAMLTEPDDNPIDAVVVTDSILSVYQKAKDLTEAQRQRLAIVPTHLLIKEALQHRFH